MRELVVANQSDALGMRVGFVRQVVDLLGKLLLAPPLDDLRRQLAVSVLTPRKLRSISVAWKHTVASATIY